MCGFKDHTNLVSQILGVTNFLYFPTLLAETLVWGMIDKKWHGLASACIRNLTNFGSMAL